jgi:hypothetical protein
MRSEKSSPVTAARLRSDDREVAGSAGRIEHAIARLARRREPSLAAIAGRARPS